MIPAELREFAAEGIFILLLLKLIFDFIRSNSMTRRLDRIENLGWDQYKELCKINGKK